MEKIKKYVCKFVHERKFHVNPSIFIFFKHIFHALSTSIIIATLKKVKNEEANKHMVRMVGFYSSLVHIYHKI